MITYQDAVRLHEPVARAHQENAALGLELWIGVTGGSGKVIPGSIGDAVRDTVPADHAALLGSADVAAAYAFDLFFRDYERRSPFWEKARAFERRDAARAIWREFEKRATDALEITRGFGWDDSAAWAIMRDVRSLGVDLHAVKRIAALAGRMHAALRGAGVRRVPGMSGEIYSVTQGSDVARLLPAETVLFDDALLELPLLHRIATDRAAQYAVRGTAKRSKGPLVVAIDESGSMHGARIEWAKAAAIALARVAKDDNRPMRVVHFSESCKVQDLRPADPSSVIEMVKTFMDGGTAIGRALSVSVDEVEALEKTGARGADIICITDGIDYTHAAQEKALDRAAKLGARLWTIAVECEIDEDYPLRARAAQYEELGRNGLNDPKSVLGAMAKAI